MNSGTLELFESVRALVSGARMDDGQWRELAMRVGETAAAFRRRTERAVRYARQGLRLEAAAEAEAEPSLFELAELLDSPEFHSWREKCRREEWPVPDAPDAAALGEIEEAIAQLQPLRKMLARMRILVLSDAGAWERLQLLRDLIGRDPHNPAWREDAAALEPVAAQWLSERAERALAAGDVATASECVQALELEEWEYASTERRARELRSELDAAAVAECAGEARELLAELEAERAAESEPSVAEALERWTALEARAARHGGTLPGDCARRTAEVRAWFDARVRSAHDRAEHEERALQLAQALEAAADLPTLRRALAASEATSEGCPDDLRARALDEIGRLERRVTLTRTSAAAGAVVIVGLLVVGIWWAVTNAADSNRIESLAAAVRGYVSTGALDAAGKLLADADADLSTSTDPRMMEARQQYMAARAAIAKGDREFDAAIAEAGDPNAERADAGDIGRAESLARTDAQRTAVEEWKRLQQRASEARTAARTQQQLAEVRAIAEEAGRLQPRPEDVEVAAAVAALEARLASVQRAAAGQPAVLREVQAAQAVLAAHRSLAATQQAERDRAESVRALTRNLGDPLALQLAMDAIVKANPGTPEADGLAESARAAPLWGAVEAWSTLAGRVPFRSLGTATQTDRDAATAAMRAYLSQYAASPYAGPARAFVGLVQPASGWRTWLEEKLDQLPPFAYYSVELKDGRRLYMTRDPATVETQRDPGGGAYRVYPVLATGGLDARTTFERVDAANVRTQGPSPQRALAATLRALVEESAAGGETSSTNGANGAPNDVLAALAVLAAVRNADAVDGAFAAQLARGVLESFEPEAPAPIQAALQAAARRIAREKPEEVEWVGGAPGARDRSKALKAVLREALKVDDWKKAYLAAAAEAATPLERRFDAVGLLTGPAQATAGRGVAVPDGRVVAKGAAIYALRVGVGDRPSAMERIGTMGDGGALQLEAGSADFPLGTMVFTVRGGGA